MLLSIANTKYLSSTSEMHHKGELKLFILQEKKEKKSSTG